MSIPQVSFVIVTYNNANTIGMCLCSIAEQTTLSFEIAIIDNSPDPHTRQAARDFISSHTGVAVRIITPGENIGFSRACNLGADVTTGKYIFFLNPDTKLMNNAAEVLAQCLGEKPSAAAAGPAIFDEDGRITRTCRKLPTFRYVFLDAIGLDRWCGAYTLRRFRHDAPRVVEQIIGAAILMRRRDFETVGGMDERFFVYFEEVDLCKRLNEQRGDIWFWPSAKVEHLGGRSCEVGRLRARMIFIFRESRKKYFAKHFGFIGAIALEALNRMEALEKLPVLVALWILRRRQSDKDKAFGFLSVAMGIPPRG